MQPKERIIVALDVDSLEKAGPLVEQLFPYVGCFKVGLELITAVGVPAAVRFVRERGGEVFLDGKFDDIPNTVGRAARAAAALGVKMFNVHASCGLESMKAAVQNKGGSLVLAVTVLTSHDEIQARLIFGAPVREKVLQMALMAREAGIDGLICSPQELEWLREPSLQGLIKVTPGVRPVWAEAGDQKRTMTPRQAIEAGATALVIGRPITQPPSEIGGPVAAVRKLVDEISKAP